LKSAQPRKGEEMMLSDEIDVVKAFIAAINRRSPSEMSDLMTEDHTLVDPGGRVESGRQNVIAGWNEYFRMFPDYTILVESIPFSGQPPAPTTASGDPFPKTGSRCRLPGELWSRMER
jgi:hypothetical protein